MSMNRSRSRKMTVQLLAVIGTILLLAGCGSAESGGSGESGAQKLSVVTSIYPLQYLAEAIGGSHAEVVNLVPAGVEPHDWTPKSRDLTAVSRADLFLYNGAGLEGWTDDFLEGIDARSNVVVVEASAGIPLIPGNPEAVHQHGHDEADDHQHEAGHDHEADHQHEAGHDHEADHDHEHDEGASEHSTDDGHNHTAGSDPHTWVSPKSMLRMAKTVRAQFAAADPAHAADYDAGYEALRARLTALDESFERELAGLPKRDIVVSHQAFGYLCRDYGLNQISIMGLSPEAEPKALDLARIAKYMKENEIKVIFFEELVSPDLARTLANEADAEVLVLNPVEGLTPKQLAEGDDYVSIMEANLQNLVKALQ